MLHIFNIIFNTTFIVFLPFFLIQILSLIHIYRYKEGFSVELVEQLIREYSKHKERIILDPFSGSGSTLLAANDMGYSGVGFEVNPFSFFLSKCKLDKYTKEIIELFKKEYEEILHNAEEVDEEYVLPKLSISEKVFADEIEKYYMNIGKLRCV